MSIINQPTIYNTPTIYNGGGGGGGEPVPDPELYTEFFCIKNLNPERIIIDDFEIYFNDEIRIDTFLNLNENDLVYIFGLTQGLFEKKAFGIQRLSGGVRLYCSGYILDGAGTIPGNFVTEQKSDVYSCNDLTYTGGPSFTGSAKFSYILNGTVNGSYIYDVIVKDGNGNTKLKFVPCLRIADSKKGLLEVYTNKFFPVHNNGNWDLIGRL